MLIFFSPHFLEFIAIDTIDHGSFLKFPAQTVLDLTSSWSASFPLKPFQFPPAFLIPSLTFEVEAVPRAQSSAVSTTAFF